MYRATLEDVRPGWEVGYTFVRTNERSHDEEFPSESFLHGPEKRLYEDMTVRASYSYGTGDGQGTVPEELPRSGGGGTDGGGAATAGAVYPLALLAAAGYAAARRPL